MENNKELSEKKQCDIHDTVSKRFLFEGKLTITNQPFSIEVDAINRESAIAYIEVSYPTFEWIITTEL